MPTKKELYPFQKAGIDWLISKKAALLSDEQGLGKTIQAICAFDRLKANRILIVCKAVGKINWQREIDEWSEKKYKIQILNGRKDILKKDSEIVILNYDLLISRSIFDQLITERFSVGVFDESHYLKSRTAKRTKATLLPGAVASRCIYKWFLTGTPILNRPVELYPVLKAVAPEVIAPYDSYERYARRFCGAYWDGFQLVDKGASNIEDLSLRLNSGFMLRRLKKDHLKELPDKQYQLVSLPAADSKAEHMIAKEFTFSTMDANHHHVSAEGAEIARLRHELALTKVAACIEHIKEILEETKKIVIFAYHHDVIDLLGKALFHEYNPVIITGNTSQRIRQFNVDHFQQVPSCRVFIGQIQAAGDTITLTAASTVIFVESSWVPGEVDQATDRLHRIGQKDSVLVQFLVIAKSLEEHMVRTMIDKKTTIQRIIEDDGAYLFT